jgi:hypothetical protein
MNSEWGQAPAGQEQPSIRARARSREDRAGDPLDGLVNLFDLGIVLSIAFLLSSLSSLNLTDDLLSGRRSESSAPPGSVVVRRDQRVEAITIRRGDRVVGQGERVGTIYRLADGRTVLVPDRSAGSGTTPPTAP